MLNTCVPVVGCRNERNRQNMRHAGGCAIEGNQLYTMGALLALIAQGLILLKKGPPNKLTYKHIYFLNFAINYGFEKYET